MGIFSIFKNNKIKENNEENSSTNFLEEYLKSKFKIDTKSITFSNNDITRIEKNCEIIEKMGIPSYKDLKLVPVDCNVKIEEKKELVLHMIFNFFVGRKACNALNNIGDVDDANVMMLAEKYVPEFNQMAEYLSAISKGKIEKNDLGNLAFLGEQAIVLAWVLGLVHKPTENELTYGSDLVSLFHQCNSIEEIIKKSSIISKDEIMEYADYISRLDLYCMELTVSKKNTESLKDLNLNLNCICEHKSAIDMVTSYSIDKYLISK